jgi:hypothetical protein
MLLNLSRDIMIPFSLLKYRKIKMTKEGENPVIGGSESRIQLGMSIDENGRPQFLSERSEEEVREKIPQIPKIFWTTKNPDIKNFIYLLWREEIELKNYDRKQQAKTALEQRMTGVTPENS